MAGLPSSAAARIETLRGASFALGRGAARALNRVMMALGEPCGCVFDWLNADIVVLRQTGVLSLPDAVQNWFDFPERCPEAQVASWLRGPGDDDLASMFCAAYLVGRPTFLKVLERLWIEAIYDGDADQLQLTGGLLAGAADDCAVSPVELRCCLGYKVGGPVPESPENAGRLLGMVLNQNGGVRKSAEALLLQMSPEYRIVAAGALRWLPHNRNPFGNEGAHPSRFGAPASPLDHASLLPPSLQPLFSMGLMKGCPPKVLLETICFGNGRKEGWAGRCIDWCNPETVQAVFLDIDSTELAGVFLSVSASPHVDMRRIAVPLAAGVGPRLLQTSYRDRIIQRLVDLAQEPDNQTRTAVARAVQRLGIADLVPVAPASAASTPDANTPGTSNIPETSEESEEETLDRLVAELEGDF